MRTTTLTTTLLAALLALLFAPPAHAQWTNDPYNGFVTVAGTPVNENSPQVCALAGGRTFIAWMRYDAPQTSYWLYYQVVDQFGNALLPANGIHLVDGNWMNGWGGPYGMKSILPDGQGGCIVVFTDKRDGSWAIWGQRVDSLGNRLWGPTGLPLVVWPGSFNELVTPKDFNSDSLGNFFLSFNSYHGMHLQKFNTSGTGLWGSLGVLVSEHYAYGQDWQQAVPDGAGGIIEVFGSAYSPGGSPQLRVQHLDAAGRPLLPLNGAPIRNLSGQIMYGELFAGVPDGAGGGVWADWKPIYPAVYVHVWRLNGQGQMQWIWTEDNMSWNQGPSDMIRHPMDGNVWLTINRGDGRWIFRFTLGGAQLFGNGVPYGGDLVASGTGVISTNKAMGTMRYYSQKVDSSGTLVWTSPEYIDHNFNYQTLFDVCGNGAEGAVVAFEIVGNWNPFCEDILAQRVNFDGTLGVPPDPSGQAPDSSLMSLSEGQLQFTLPQAGHVKVDLFDLLGRRVATLENDWREAGTYRLAWNDRGLASGIYLLRMEIGGKMQARKVVVVR